MRLGIRNLSLASVARQRAFVLETVPHDVANDHLLTEADDNLTTEDGHHLLVES